MPDGAKPAPLADSNALLKAVLELELTSNSINDLVLNGLQLDSN
jgi:hypothetical protein